MIVYLFLKNILLDALFHELFDASHICQRGIFK